MLQVGEVLAGKYRVDRVIGRGGMGIVVAATHLQLHQAVALKFLLPDFASNRSVVERFLREARASARLRGEHVCRVSDVGTLDSGAPYIVMELMEGEDLSTMIEHHGPLPVHVAADFILQACIGVAEAHGLDVVHRDLKPANLFLHRRPDGSALIKVLDFGIAKAQAETNFQLTQTSAILGSPGYMSPEQLRSSRDVDRRSDIWALGVILYEIVTGRRPFDGESITELALRVAMDPTPPLMVNLPPGFAEVIYRCLEKDPRNRYQDLAQLAYALAPFGGPHAREIAMGVARVLNPAGVPQAEQSMRYGTAPISHVPITAVPISQTSNTPVPTTMGSAASSLVTSQAPSRARWGIIAGAAFLVLAIGIPVALSMRGGGDKPEPGAGSTPATPTVDAAAQAQVTPDAAQPVTVDAAVATVPEDAAAAAPPDASEPAVATTQKPDRARPDKKKPDSKKKPTNTKKPDEEDLGGSRF